MDDGQIVCTELRGQEIQYPGEIFSGLDLSTEARISVKVHGNSDQSMTKRFFLQWLRFENGLQKLKTDYPAGKTSPTTQSSYTTPTPRSSLTSSDEEQETTLQNHRKLDTDQLVFETDC